MNYEARYEIKQETNGTFAIVIRMTGDIFQEGFDSKKDALKFLKETFG